MMWIPFQFRLMSGDTATQVKVALTMWSLRFGRKTDINTIYTHSLCISKESVKKTSHSVYCKYEGIQGGKSEVCLMLQGREPPLMSWFSGAYLEATGKLPGATSACNPDVGAPQEAHLGIASGLTSAHLSGCSTSGAQCLSFSSTDHVSHQCLNGQL